MKETYRGYTIVLNERSRQFVVTGDGIDAEAARCFESYALAKAGIDAQILLVNKMKRTTIGLDVRTPDGKACKITGIHPRNRTLNGISGAEWVCPDVPWLSALLEERGRLLRRVAEIDKLARPYSMISNVGGWGLMNAEKYEGAVNELTDRYKQVRARAEKEGGST